MVSTLTRMLGPRHLSLAEEAARDALIKALQLWPHEGVPANPSAWLIQVAKNRALDLLRRDQRLTELDAQRPAGERADQRADVAAILDAAGGDDPSTAARLRGEPAPPDDDELAMMFLACHPSVSREARVALTLKVVCGF